MWLDHRRISRNYVRLGRAFPTTQVDIHDWMQDIYI